MFIAKSQRGQEKPREKQVSKPVVGARVGEKRRQTSISSAYPSHAPRHLIPTHIESGSSS